MKNYNEITAAATKYKEWLDFLSRFGADKAEIDKADRLLGELNDAIERVKVLSVAENPDEPNDYDAIVACSEGIKAKAKPSDYSEKLRGALIGRICGCVLGAPVEGWSIEGMKIYAELTGTPFPPAEYWHGVTNPEGIQYNVSKRKDFVLGNMDSVPTDDDIMYPLLNLMLVEEYGVDFTVEDVGKHWLKYMTVCCTAEYEALESLKKGIKATEAANGNPYVEWIGAAIRADLFGYICPGNPELAARLAYRDAYLSHRRNGIYGEMYLAAVIASAFTADSMEQALRDGLKVIPKKCALYEDLSWAIEQAPKVKGWKASREAVDKRFPDMFWVDTRNNLCLIVFALMNSRTYSEAISETVAMGHDNDCTAATVGSIYGAMRGIASIEPRWYECFNGKIRCFLKDNDMFELEDVLKRIERITKKTLCKK